MTTASTLGHLHDPPLTLPSFGAFLQHLREHARTDRPRGGMNRAELATVAQRSLSYITKLEQGRAQAPSPLVIDSLADALGATTSERRHLHNLSRYRPAATIPTPDAQKPLSDETKLFVDGLAPQISALFDYAWNVQYGNSEYRRLFRRIDEAGNLLIWLFEVPESRRIIVEWEDEALITVSWVRSLMVAENADENIFSSLLDRLSRSREFRTMWDRNDVALTRDRPETILRDLDHGMQITVRSHVLRWPDPARGMQLYLGVQVNSQHGQPGTTTTER